MEGPELRVTKELWQDLAASEMRLSLMRELVKLKLGFKEIEEFNLGLVSKLRSDRMRNRGEKARRKLIDSAMEIKIRDEERFHEEKMGEKNRKRREIGERLRKNSRPYRNLMRMLKDLSHKVKEEHRIKYDKKVEHLKRKYHENEEEKLDRVPDHLRAFKSLSIFDRGKFEEIKVSENEVLCVSDGVELSDDERAVLRRHTKFPLSRY